jgi:hypothetical protein
MNRLLGSQTLGWHDRSTTYWHLRCSSTMPVLAAKVVSECHIPQHHMLATGKVALRYKPQLSQRYDVTVS